MDYKLSEIAKICGGRLSGPDMPIRGISIDSRSLQQGSDTLFIALTGPRNDGHHYIPELYERGTRAFMISRSMDKTLVEARYIHVENTLQALQKLAAHHRNEQKAKILGITGSNGKTIVKEWLYQLLRQDLRICRSPRSYNSQVGVPQSLLMIDSKDELGIIEAGISQPGEMERLEAMIRPDVGLITNLGDAHQENFRDMEEKGREKFKLFRKSQMIVYCTDDELINKLARAPRARTLSWGRKSADIIVQNTKKEDKGLTIDYHYNNKEHTLTIPFTDKASAENAMHCVACLYALGYDAERYTEAFARLTPVAMRLEMVKGRNNCTLINDSYNADLGSLSIALDFLDQQQDHAKKTLILSDILQSASDGEKMYREIARMVNQRGLDKLIGIGPELSRYADMFSGNCRFHPDVEGFMKVDPFSFHEESILIKGSRSFGFERIIHALREQAHATRLEVNLNAITHNLNHFRSLIPTGTRLMVMVKALTYGSGKHEIARHLQHLRADYLAVAFADEGAALRKAGVSLPVMVMGTGEESLEVITENGLEPEIYSFSILKAFVRHMQRHGLDSYPVHIKIDTGMHRLGFEVDEVPKLADLLKQHPQVEVRSMLSHLAAADDPAFESFTLQQIADFQKACLMFRERTGKKPLCHILNSAGIERYPKAAMDMVRLGIGLYGHSLLAPGKMMCVSEFKTRIMQVKELKNGQTAGYSRAGKAQGGMRIATIPVGYADGLPRSAGKGRVSLRVKGKTVPTFGNICMDMSMVDITGTGAREGDEVCIFGKDQPVAQLARQLGTIPYELFAGISERVKRVYYHE